MNDSNTLAPLPRPFHQAGWGLSSAIGACAILILSASHLAASPSTGGEFSLVGSAVGSGGSAAGGSFSLEGTAGLPSTGVSSGGDFVVTGGLIGVYVVPGDFEVSLVRVDASQVRLSWPADAGGYVLEFTPQVGPTAVWTRVTPAPAGNSLLVPFDQPARFYRLRKP